MSALRRARREVPGARRATAPKAPDSAWWSPDPATCRARGERDCRGGACRAWFLSAAGAGGGAGLLGRVLVHQVDGIRLAARILETEAYQGPDDWRPTRPRGRTPRTEPMFWRGGQTYVLRLRDASLLQRRHRGGGNLPRGVGESGRTAGGNERHAGKRSPMLPGAISAADRVASPGRWG